MGRSDRPHRSSPIWVSNRVEQRTGHDQLLGRGELGRQEPVGAGSGDALAGHREGRRGSGPGHERCPKVEPARRGHELDGENPPKVVDRGPELACGSPSHRNVILLHRARRDRVDARGRPQTAVLRHERRLGVMGEHQPRVDPGILGEERRKALRARRVKQAIGPPLGDRSDRPDRGGEEVAGKRNGCPVEVPARFDATVRQHHRVVDRSMQFVLGDALRMGQRVPRRARDLGGAAQRVRILDARVTVAVACDDLRAAEQHEQVVRARRLPGLGPERDEVAGERAVGAEQRLDRHRRCDVGDAEQFGEVAAGEHEHPEHPVGPVDQRQALLGAQLERR